MWCPSALSSCNLVAPIARVPSQTAASGVQNLDLGSEAPPAEGNDECSAPPEMSPEDITVEVNLHSRKDFHAARLALGIHHGP